MNRYKYILLDVDDTLLNFQEAEKNGVAYLLNYYKIEATEELIASYSKINDALWKAFEKGEIEKKEILEKRFSLFFQSIGKEIDGLEAERIYRNQLDQSAVPIDGAEEILKALYEKYELYVVTNGTSETQYNRLALSGFDQYVKGIFVSEDTGYQKPLKEYFAYCFEKMGTSDVSKMLIVGDSLSSDIKGGNNVGIDTCWFNWKNKKNTDSLKVDYEIHELKELLKFL